MGNTEHGTPGHTRHASRRGTAAILAATLLAIPVGTLAWVELLYLVFGLTGRDPLPVVELLTFLASFGVAFGWPLLHGHRAAAVVRRSCRLGLGVSLALPLVAFAVLLIWENADDRPDLGMGGLMLYSLPYVAIGIAVVLAILFSIGEKLAAQRLQL